MRMNHVQRILALAALCISFVAAGPAGADAAFGPAGFDGGVFNADGSSAPEAGSHPFSASTTITFNQHPDPDLFFLPMPDADVKDIHVEVPPGLVGNAQAAPTCKESQLIDPEKNGGNGGDSCPFDSQVGYVEVLGPMGTNVVALYNMVPAAGVPATFAFTILQVPVHLSASLRSDGDYGLTVDVNNISQGIPVLSSTLTFWGVPADPGHNIQRCRTLNMGGTVFPPACNGSGDSDNEPHAPGMPPTAFLTNPTACTPAGVGLETRLAVDSWPEPGVFQRASFFSHDAADPLTQLGPTECERVPFSPSLAAQPTTDEAETPSGLNFELEIPEAGLVNATGIAQSSVRKAVVTLPQGMSVNPSAGEGLGVCRPADFARETASSEPGAGCPSSSKIGTVEIESPLVKETAHGALYIAQQDDPRTSTPGAENPFDSLLALYIVAKIPDRGILVKLAGKVDPDPRTGRLTTTFDDLPQLPFNRFTLKFREGQRSPLVSPPACGSYGVNTELTPYSAPGAPVTRTSTFTIEQGVGGGACPASSALRPFRPGLQAGTMNNNAGSFSPFNIRMTRNDGEQEITSFSAELPPGLSGKLAGVPSCSDADIARAAGRTGTEENADPSCPAASQVGRSLAGAGVGSVLAYAPGRVYLAGPYHGSPLSVAAITSATVGPFDLGTVVVRSALRIDPGTAQVSVDSAGSDPIPHILRGIPLHVRDIRVYMDRPSFTLNPTSCDPFAVRGRLTGSGADFASPGDDVAALVENPFQAANCANLGFKPKLAFRLRGGTHRGDYPAFTATLRARPGDANIARAAVTLPHSEFLAQEHIRTICTRVQFAQDACPAASVYGYARATSPLLDEPLQGPVYLRSSSNPLPDLVADLNGRFEVVLSGRIDSKNRGIRNTFDVVPDAPVTKFTLAMQGGKKGLLVNSTNLCKSVNRANVRMTGQNGKAHNSRPAVVAQRCGKVRKRSG